MDTGLSRLVKVLELDWAKPVQSRVPSGPIVEYLNVLEHVSSCFPVVWIEVVQPFHFH